MKEEPVKKFCSEPLTAAQQAELEALATLMDGEINTSDIPEQRDWTGARRGLLFRSISG